MTTDTQSTEDDLRAAQAHAKRLTWLAYVGIAVAVAAIAAFVGKFARSPFSDDPQHWGQLGDYLGGVLNPTFSFLALLALLATLGIQVRELRLSVRELRNSADALVKQNETLRQQTFEGTFFQLLRLHNDIVASLSIPGLSLHGRACLAHYCSEIRGRLINAKATEDPAKFLSVYAPFHEEHLPVLGHYFRLLYNIVKLVDQTDGIDQRFYTNLVRAQLSSDEVLLLFYNCLSPWGDQRFKPMLESFALLKTLPTDKLPSEVLLRQYEVGAFGGSYPTYDSSGET